MVYTWILGLALIGLILSSYIFWKKKKSEKLVCFIGQDCDTVIHSRYSKLLFGIPNEILGMVYYGFDIVLAGLAINGGGAPFGFSVNEIFFTISGIAAF